MPIDIPPHVFPDRLFEYIGGMGLGKGDVMFESVLSM
jgi:hypothetical protein